MAQDVVINGITYPAVESVALDDGRGNTVMFYPDAVRYGKQTLTEAQKVQARENLGFIRTFDTFPTVEEINALPNWSYFSTKGFHNKNDGLGATYQVKNSSSAFYVPYGNMYYRPVMTDWDTRDIYVDLYGVRRGSADYSVRNSEIMDALTSTLQNGFTVHFASGHYYFDNPISVNKYTVFKGVARDACVYSNPSVTSDPNYGTYLHFPNLANGEAAISISGGVVENLEIAGNPSICDVSLDRNNTVTAPSSIVSLVDTGTTYGIKVDGNHTIYNVKVRNCTYGIYAETTNALISNIDILKCKVGISVGNDIKINNVQVWNTMVGVELRGQLASATNIRGDSIGKHLVECKRGKCLLTNIDGDYCVGSLIHYGGDMKYMHLGQATACMGRVATKYAYTRSGGFNLQNVPDSDYEYCTYISIAPNTQVFGGQIDVVNVAANPKDSASGYLHPNAVLSIGTGSTVKGLIVKCNIPHSADATYFNTNVIKNLSSYAEATNDGNNYLTDFDGSTIEDIGFVTPTRFVRSLRTKTVTARTLITSEITDADKNAIATAVKSSLSANDVKNILGYTPADEADTSIVTDMVIGVGIEIPSINFNDNVWEDGYFNASGADYLGSYSGQCFRNKNYIPVVGGSTITCYYVRSVWNKNDNGGDNYIIQYDANKAVINGREIWKTYAVGEATFKLASNAAYIRFAYHKWATLGSALSEIQIAFYTKENARKEYVTHEPTIIGENKLSLEDAVIPSSTAGSKKKFRLTVDDSGAIKAVEL